VPTPSPEASPTQEPEAAILPSPSQQLTETALPSFTQEPEKTVLPSPTPKPVETALAPAVDFGPDAGISQVVSEQLGQGSGGYFLLQFNSIPLDQDTQSKLKESNVILFDHVPESAYYAYLPPESLSTLEELLKAGTLRHVGPIPGSAKLDTGLQEKVQADPQQRLEVIAQFFEEPSLADQKKLEELMEVTAYSFGPVNFAEGTVLAANVEEIVSLSFVKWVEEQPINKLFDSD
jgi:hypothetical protein